VANPRCTSTIALHAHHIKRLSVTFTHQGHLKEIILNTKPQAPWLQTFEEFMCATIIVDVHQTESGGYAFGKAMGEALMQSSAQVEALQAEFVKAKGNIEGLKLLEAFKRKLESIDYDFDVIFIAGHTGGMKHVLLNNLLVTPPDLLMRAFEYNIRIAIDEGLSVPVPGTDVDPRETLLAQRSHSIH
jgi:hypothetical protein